MKCNDTNSFCVSVIARVGHACTCIQDLKIAIGMLPYIMVVNVIAQYHLYNMENLLIC